MATLNNLFGFPQSGSRGAFARPLICYRNCKVLAANVAESDTPPAGANYVIFGADGDFYALADSDPAVPSADISDGTSPEINPIIMLLEGVTTVRVVSETAGRVITLSYYK